MKNLYKKWMVGRCIEVNSRSIDKSLFEEKREDKAQEEVRKLILKAFDAESWRKRKFRTMVMIPKKDYLLNNLEDYREFIRQVKKFGMENAHWNEQALEWAQRISNGETWETVCNADDTVQYGRLVYWEDGKLVVVGGFGMYCDTFHLHLSWATGEPSRRYKYPFNYVSSTPSSIWIPPSEWYLSNEIQFKSIVPLVVMYYD